MTAQIFRPGSGPIDMSDCPCCDQESSTSLGPAVDCPDCATGQTAKVVTLILSGLINGACANCAGIAGTFEIAQDPFNPCSYFLDVSLPCGYNRVVAGFGGFVTTYSIEVANTTNGRKFSLLKNVFGAGNNDCLTHWNNGGWSFSNSSAGDCDSIAVSYAVNAA